MAASRVPEWPIAVRWRPGHGGQRLVVTDPATEAGLGGFPAANRDDLNEAVGAAGTGFAVLRQRPARERADIPERGAARMPQRLETIAAWRRP